MVETKKIYDGDVVARVNAAIEAYKANKHVYYNNDMHNAAESVKGIKKLYKRSGWKAVANLIQEVNRRCWEEHYCMCENVSKFYAELYHAACAWYQGYPANAEEQKLCDEGREDEIEHVSDDDLMNIYRYLD